MKFVQDSHEMSGLGSVKKKNPRWRPFSIDSFFDLLAVTTSFLVCSILVCFALLLRVLRLVLTHLILG